MELSHPEVPGSASGRPGWVVLLLLGVVLAALFFPSFLPGRTLFANDDPLGVLMSDYRREPAGFSGVWLDLNGIGYNEGGPSPSISSGLLLLLGPLAFSKFYAPITLLILGLGAWFFFRQLKLLPSACLLGALAAMLNSGFFSAACWGVGSQMVALGMDFVALGLVMDHTSPRRWLRIVLAGLAVGMGVVEGADIGALFSVVVAAFVVWDTCARESALGRGLVKGMGRVTLIAIVAALLAAEAIVMVVSTNITGIAGMQQDARSRHRHWDWATQWSLPKREALSLLVPGLFGYRMDARDGGSYWGAAGRDPAWDRFIAEGKQGPPPRGMMRYSGGGIYAGVLVCWLALWAVLRSLHRKDAVYSDYRKKFIWFWASVGLVSLLLAFGRFAPFYQIVYALPYVSAVRNPAKFLHVLEWALVILFGCGVDGIIRHCLSTTGRSATAGGAGRTEEGELQSPASAPNREPEPPERWNLREWWKKAEPFDKNWLKGSLIALEIGVVAWVVYALTRNRLAAYLEGVDFTSTEAAAVAAFSARQPGWFILFLSLSLLLVTLILSGWFSGRRARVGVFLLGMLLTVDLCRANLPWIVYWDYPAKYASNPVIELLREKPYEHRVAMWPFPSSGSLELLDKLYRIEWLQHQFRYYNIQSLDLVQMRSKPVDLVAFDAALDFDGTTNTVHHLARRWELTNTRFLLGTTNLLPILNEKLDPAMRRFRIFYRFGIVPRPGLALATRCDELTAVANPNGPYAVFEFTGALPRAGLNFHWQVNTNAPALLEQLTSPAFNPRESVLLSTPLPATPLATSSQQGATAEFVAYAPKKMVLTAKADAASVLLLNDRFDPNWKVRVDGRSERVLCCNSVMMGVYLNAGGHRVEFYFEPPMRYFYLSLITLTAGLALCGWLAVPRRN